MESQINLLLFVLSIVSTSGGQQGTHCQVFPSNYTFTTRHIANAHNGILEFNNCTTNLPYTTCPHPSILTDSNTGGDTFHPAQYLEWISANEFSQLLFTFSTEVDLEFGRVYYYFNRPGDVIRAITLEFLAVPDDFTLGTTTPPHSTSLHNASIIDFGRNIFIPLSTTTRKLLVNKRGGQDTNFAISEVEFYTDSSVCETMTTSSTTPSEVTDPLSTTSQTDTLPPETTATEHPKLSHTDTPTLTLTTDGGVENKATSTDSLTIVGYIIASVAMVWMMVLTGVVLVNLYYIMYFYK